MDEPPMGRQERPSRTASGGYSDDPGASPSPFDEDENEIDIPPFLRGQRRRQQR
jgi:hypothetical protein